MADTWSTFPVSWFSASFVVVSSSSSDSSYSSAAHILIGSFSVLIYAYVMRYMAVGISPLKSSFEKHPTSFDDTALNLGMGPVKLFRKIHLPINMSAIAIALLITFVDIIKELPRVKIK